MSSNKTGQPKFNVVRDCISGAIMAATSIPHLVAYAETVGYASYRGLASAGPSLFAWGLVTGSPLMISGVTSMTALMTKTDLNGEEFVTKNGEPAYRNLVAAYSLWIGFASILLAVLGFGKIAQIVPKTVRSGFKWGCALAVVASAVPNGLLANGASELKKHVASSATGDLVRALKLNAPAATGAVSNTHLLFACLQPQLWSPIPALLFFACTWFVMNAPRFLPKSLPPGTEVIIATTAATLLSMYTAYPGGIVGEIPSLDPDEGIDLGLFRIPIGVMNPKDLMDAPLADRFGGSYIMLIVSATLFAAINFLSIMGIAAGFESENGIAWSPPRELISQGVACVVAGFTGSAPVSGSMSRSLVSRMTGTTSQMACMITALIWIYLMPYMNIMSPTPKAALSAVIVSAVIKSVVYPKELIALKGNNFIIAWGTAIATAVTSPTIGFGVGVVLAGALGGFKKDAVKKKIT